MKFFFHLIVALLIISFIERCGSFTSGFGSYERPCKWTNNYYSRRFQLLENKWKLEIEAVAAI